jgi:hypothetical protein
MSTDLLHGFAINRRPLLPLRLMVGFGFMQHALAKLANSKDDNLKPDFHLTSK